MNTTVPKKSTDRNRPICSGRSKSHHRTQTSTSQKRQSHLKRKKRTRRWELRFSVRKSGPCRSNHHRTPCWGDRSSPCTARSKWLSVRQHRRCNGCRRRSRRLKRPSSCRSRPDRVFKCTLASARTSRATELRPGWFLLWAHYKLKQSCWIITWSRLQFCSENATECLVSMFIG